jgi:hypothetical protein
VQGHSWHRYREWGRSANEDGNDGGEGHTKNVRTVLGTVQSAVSMYDVLGSLTVKMHVGLSLSRACACTHSLSFLLASLSLSISLDLLSL